MSLRDLPIRLDEIGYLWLCQSCYEHDIEYVAEDGRGLCRYCSPGKCCEDCEQAEEKAQAHSSEPDPEPKATRFPRRGRNRSRARRANADPDS